MCRAITIIISFSFLFFKTKLITFRSFFRLTCISRNTCNILERVGLRCCNASRSIQEYSRVTHSLPLFPFFFFFQRFKLPFPIVEIFTTNLLDGYTYIYFFLFFNKNVIEIKFSQGIYTGREKVGGKTAVFIILVLRCNLKRKAERLITSQRNFITHD